MMPNSEHQPKVIKNLEELFDMTERPDPVEQGKVWSELANKQLDDTDDLLLNKLTVELIINQNKDE
jgi:hypothetical protein